MSGILGSKGLKFFFNLAFRASGVSRALGLGGFCFEDRMDRA